MYPWSTTAFFNSNAFTITNESQILSALDLCTSQIMANFANFIQLGSEWVLEETIGHYVNILT